MTAKHRYFTCPIYLLSEIRTNKESALEKALHYGIYSFMDNMDNECKKRGERYVKLDELVTQMIYCIYRRELPTEIRHYLRRHDFDYLGQDEDYNGFSGLTFEPNEYEREELLKLFDKDSDFMHTCYNFIAIRKVHKVFFKERNYTEDYSIVGRYVKTETPERSATFDININILLDFRYNNKTEYELEQLVCFLALRSMLGKKTSHKGTWENLLIRMLGYTRKVDLPKKLNAKQKALLDKYSKTYQRRKLFKAMEDKWHIYFDKTNNKRGFLFSMEKDNLKVFESEFKKTKEYKKAKQQEQHDQVKRRLLEELKEKDFDNKDKQLPF
jgi:hypothetical protein